MSRYSWTIIRAAWQPTAAAAGALGIVLRAGCRRHNYVLSGHTSSGSMLRWTRQIATVPSTAATI
jgi:hypothetical protein